MNISIILAAGEGSRMKSKIPKILHTVCGRPILDYVIDVSRKANIDKNYVIIGHGGEEVRKVFKESRVDFIEQPIGDKQPYGTGFAAMQAIDYIDDESNVIILYGDTPLIEAETIKNFMEFHRTNNHVGTVLTTRLDNPAGYGRIIRNKENEIVKIVEDRDASKEELRIREVNSGIYVFKGKNFKDALKEIDDKNIQGEYYLTDIIKVLKDQDHKIATFFLEDAREIYGINSKAQLALCEEIMRERINTRHMEDGVTIINPKNTYIEMGVEIGQDSIIYPGSIITKGSIIGNDCIIGENSRIENSKIANGVEIHSSTIKESRIDDKCRIGPYAHLRPNCHLASNVRIGNFVELKNSTMGPNSKAGHLAYIGDADIGHNVNVGSGVIFVNYDGKKKHRSKIEDDAFVGSNSNIIAPVTIGKGAYIAAGSTITEDVKEASLSIARARQVNKNDWVKNRLLDSD